MGTKQTMSEWIFEWRSTLVVGACALMVTMLCVGGAVALMIDDQPRYEAGAGVEVAPIPVIVTADTAVLGGLGESVERSAETVRAGEVVYAAAEQSLPPTAGMLRQLREALDDASLALEDELPDGASKAQRERHIEELEERRASVLDAASMITQVRRVPAEDLPAGTTTVTDPAVEPSPEEPERSEEPEDEASPRPSEEPSGELPGEPSEEPSGTPSEEQSPEPAGDPSPDPSGESSDETPSGGLAPQDPADDAGPILDLFRETAPPGDPASPAPSPSGSSAG